MRSFNKSKNEDGFVLITALMVIFLVVTIVTTVALVTASDLRASAKARAIITTRFMSESVSDSIFSSIARENTDLKGKAINKFAVDDGNPPGDANHPLWPSSTTTNYGLWFVLLPDGSITRCINNTSEGIDYRRETCFKARISQNSVSAAKRQEVVLDVVARGACIVDGSTLKNCVYRKFQQIFRTRTYIDTVSLTESEVPSISGVDIDPSTGAPYKVAYLEDDSLTGSIHTNDGTGFFYCGTVPVPPDPNDLKFSSETDIPETFPPTVPGCAGGSFPAITVLADQFIPNQIDKRGNDDLVNAQSVFSSLAGGGYSASNYYLTTKPVPAASYRIELNPGNIKIDGNTLDYPSNGVIYVADDAVISGKYSRSLTIAVSGNVTISGDLTIDKSGVEINGETITPTETDPILGITTQGNFILNCNGGGGKCEPRHLVGVFSAPAGTMYNDGWASAPIGAGDPPRIWIYGSVVTKNHPVFGSYTSVSNAEVTNGWAKSLKFDSRLLYAQPPYFFRTTQASVVRSAISVFPCTDAICRSGS